MAFKAKAIYNLALYRKSSPTALLDFDQKYKSDCTASMSKRLLWLHLVVARDQTAVFLTMLNKLLILNVPCILILTLSFCAYAVCSACHVLHLKNFYLSSQVQFICHFKYPAFLFSSHWSDSPYT